MKRFKNFLMILLNAAGVFTSAFSLMYTEKLNNFIFQSHIVCDIGKYVSCSTVYLSEYAILFGIPVSLFALIYFWFLLSVFVLNKPKATEEILYSIIGIINIAGLFVCFYLLFILLFVLKNLCISCLVIDLVVLLNVIFLMPFVVKLIRQKDLRLKQLLTQNVLVWVSFLFLFTTGLLLYGAYKRIIYKKNSSLLTMYYKQEPVSFETNDNTFIWGNKKGNSEIIIFNDFLCAYCKIASERYRKIIHEDFPDVRLDFICYPLHHKNPDNSGAEPANIRVAKYMLAARHDEAFWDFHDAVLEQNHIPDSSEIMNMAHTYLQNYSRFIHGFLYENNDSLIIKNITLASQLKISGTPVVFINGRELKQWTNIGLLKMILSKPYNNP
jgi:uncharacterized membrane protein/protein-disulfide isomerase